MTSFDEQFDEMSRSDLASGRYEEQVPETILGAIQSLRIMEENVAGAIGASFFNTAWKHQETGEVFTCTARFAAGLIARQRNLYVADQKSGPFGDLFGLWKDWKDEIYVKWLEDVYGGTVYSPFEAVMNERGWFVDHGYWEREG